MPRPVVRVRVLSCHPRLLDCRFQAVKTWGALASDRACDTTHRPYSSSFHFSFAGGGTLATAASLKYVQICSAMHTPLFLAGCGGCACQGFPSDDAFALMSGIR
eukprot:2278161-Amphidinium_carterae.1